MEALPELPDSPVTFTNPPVGEVALAVQMARPVGDDGFALGKFWPAIQGDFPRLEQQVALPPLEEVFGDNAPPAVTFQLLDRPPDRRHWFVSEDQTRLVQVQPDRFAFNWRKEPTLETVDKYPRYERLREHFFELYSAYVQAAAQSQLSVTPVLAELTYINIIATEAGAERPDLSALLLRVSDHVNELLGPSEDSTLNERWLLTNQGEPYGRFHLQAAPVNRITDNVAAFMVTLIVRSYVASHDTAGVIGRLDESRNLIVNTFKEMTTPEMHERWGLQ